jgi:glycosyltransferase involved in cell wall biosynthesis
MNVLFVTPFLPYPPVSGGRMQAFLRLSNLKKRGTAVFLMTLGLPGDTGNVLALKKFLDDVECIYARPDFSKARGVFRKSLLYEIFTYDRRFGKTLRRFVRAKGIDVAVFEGLGVAQYRDDIPDVPSVLYEHNVEHEVIGQLVAYLRKSPLKRVGGRADETLRNLYLCIFGAREKGLVHSLETAALKKFDTVMTCSERDAYILKEEAPDVCPLTIPWGIEIPGKRWAPGERAVRNIVFVGSMAWEPNRDAITWFVSEIFPIVRRGPVKTRLVIAGSSMTGEIAGLDNGVDIIVKGFVEDISEVLLDADVFIAPVRFGSGVNVKVLEAMSYGVPVVTTPKGAEGTGGRHGEHFMVAQNEGEFASAIGRLFENTAAGESLSVKGRQYISEHHGMDKVIGIFEEALVSVVKKRESRPGGKRVETI